MLSHKESGANADVRCLLLCAVRNFEKLRSMHYAAFYFFMLPAKEQVAFRRGESLTYAIDFHGSLQF